MGPRNALIFTVLPIVFFPAAIGFPQQRPYSQGESAKKVMNEVQIIILRARQVPTHRVAFLVQERGVDFEPADDYLQQVRLGKEGSGSRETQGGSLKSIVPPAEALTRLLGQSAPKFPTGSAAIILSLFEAVPSKTARSTVRS